MVELRRGSADPGLGGTDGTGELAVERKLYVSPATLCVHNSGGTFCVFVCTPLCS